MGVTNQQAGTRVDEIAAGIYRISTPAAAVPGGFTFNQFLVDDAEPLLYHTGPKKLFPLVAEAVASVLAVARLRWLAFSHFEADECGALNDFLTVAPAATPLCGNVAKMVSVDDVAIRPARGLADGEEVPLGRHTVRWLETPHLPHGWECGHLFESSTRTLFCGDLFTQGGDRHEPLTEADILGPSEVMRAGMDYYAHAADTRVLLGKLAATQPRVLACMHGASWRGDGQALLARLADVVCR